MTLSFVLQEALSFSFCVLQATHDSLYICRRLLQLFFKAEESYLYVISLHIVVLPCNCPLDFSCYIIFFPEMGYREGDKQTIQDEGTSPVHNVIFVFSVLHSSRAVFSNFDSVVLLLLFFFYCFILTWYFELLKLV